MIKKNIFNKEIRFTSLEYGQCKYNLILINYFKKKIKIYFFKLINSFLIVTQK